MIQVDEQVFKGKNYTITSRGAWFILDDMVNPNQEFDSFEELVASHPVCEESRTFFFGICPVGDDKNETEAQQLIAEHPKASDLMTILDTAAYPSDQDWDLGQTTWTLNDGSKIRICGTDVEAIVE